MFQYGIITYVILLIFQVNSYIFHKLQCQRITAGSIRAYFHEIRNILLGVHCKYTSSTLQVHFKYTTSALPVHFKYNTNTLQVHFNYMTVRTKIRKALLFQ